MPTLNFKEFRCVSPSPEAGDNSPYWVFFHGHPDHPTQTNFKRVRRASWDNNIDAGDFRVVNEPISKIADTRSVLLMMLIEEDDDPDLQGKRIGTLQGFFEARFKKLVDAGAKDTVALGDFMMEYWVEMIRANLKDDDVFQATVVPITKNSGPLPLIHLLNKGAYYRVRLEMSP